MRERNVVFLVSIAIDTKLHKSKQNISVESWQNEMNVATFHKDSEKVLSIIWRLNEILMLYRVCLSLARTTFTMIALLSCRFYSVFSEGQIYSLYTRASDFNDNLIRILLTYLEKEFSYALFIDMYLIVLNYKMMNHISSDCFMMKFILTCIWYCSVTSILKLHQEFPQNKMKSLFEVLLLV